MKREFELNSSPTKRPINSLKVRNSSSMNEKEEEEGNEKVEEAKKRHHHQLSILIDLFKVRDLRARKKIVFSSVCPCVCVWIVSMLSLQGRKTSLNASKGVEKKKKISEPVSCGNIYLYKVHFQTYSFFRSIHHSSHKSMWLLLAGIDLALLCTVQK